MLFVSRLSNPTPREVLICKYTDVSWRYGLCLFLSNILQVFQGAIKYEKLESCLQILADIASTSPKLFVYGETHQFIPFSFQSLQCKNLNFRVVIKCHFTMRF